MADVPFWMAGCSDEDEDRLVRVGEFRCKSTGQHVGWRDVVALGPAQDDRQ